ncbi:hypothetical protein AB0I72_23525 [Nocardiopsis sp. NPDC049922]|uniref:hypothetical protein n=1 Tax=Nocardiopsis sp. NPDC049922 TaxID=3155157 RepID=UPI003405C41E
MSYPPTGPQQPYGVPPQPPKQGMSTGAKIGIFGCGGCLVLVVLGAIFLGVLGALVGGDEDTTVASEPSASAPADEGQEQETAAEEEAAEETSGVTMTATAAGTVGDVIDDTVYTAIDIEIVNDSDESIEVNPIYFTVELADGTVVSDWADAAFADLDNPLDTVTVQPGQRASGQIAVVGEVTPVEVTMEELFGLEDPVTATVE